MERYICPVIEKKICPYKDIDSFYADERCTPCTIPEIYMGIRPNVPESHCEAATSITGYEKPAPSVSTALDKIYYDMINNCPEFKSLSMDHQDKMMDDLAKVLDKYGLV